MYRSIIVCLILIAGFVIVGAIGSGMVGSKSQPENEKVSDTIADLKAERIKCLEKRIEVFNKNETEPGEQINFRTPEIDLLLAKLQYAGSNEERLELYYQLFDQYDELLVVAKRAIEDPRNVTSYLDEANLYYLQSEKLRFQIEALELE